MHEKPIEQLKTHDVGGIRVMGARMAFERTLQNTKSSSLFQRSFINAIQYLTNNDGIEDVYLDHLDKLPKTKITMFYLGDLLKRQLRHESKGFGKKRFDRTGKVRAGSFLQNLLFKTKNSGIDLSVLNHPEFLRGLCGEDNVLDIHDKESLGNIVRGAESMFDYFDRVRQEPDVLFVGTDENLDVSHNIDLVVARTFDLESENPTIDRVDLVEVKSSPPNNYDAGNIHNAHLGYCRVHREALFRGIKTEESHLALKGLMEHEPEKVEAYLKERFVFLKLILEILEKGFVVNEWADLVKLAKANDVDPVVLVMRITNVPDFIKKIISEEEMRRIILMKREIAKIKVPVEVIGQYRRLYTKKNGMPNTFNTLSWRSVVAYRFGTGWANDTKLIEEI